MERPNANLFPTFDRLREVMGELRLPTLVPFDQEIDLLGFKPVATSGLAAVVFFSKRLVRKTWAKTFEVSTASFEKLETEPRPVPRAEDPARYVLFEHRYRAHDARRQRCTFCAVTNGRISCMICSGTGKETAYDGYEERTVVRDCVTCSGSGWRMCSTCDGTMETISVSVNHSTDTPLRDHRVYVPSLVSDLDDKVGRAILALGEELPSSCLIDLAPSIVQSAYRGAAGVTKPMFHDYDYLDAHDRARSGIPASAENTLLREDTIWGWPFLCVRWTINNKDIDVGIVSDQGGTWRAVFAGPPLVGPP